MRQSRRQEHRAQREKAKQERHRAERDVFRDKPHPSLLLVKGDRVRVQGLESKAGKRYNGEEAEVLSYDADKERFAVNIKNAGERPLVRQRNLEFLSREGWPSIVDRPSAMHVLVTASIDSRRSLEAFKQCMMSLGNQSRKRRHFSIFVGIDGPKDKFRKKARTYMQTVAEKRHDIRLFLIDAEGKGQGESAAAAAAASSAARGLSQFEMLKILHAASVTVNPLSLLLFCDSVDFFSPYRVSAFSEVARMTPGGCPRASGSMREAGANAGTDENGEKSAAAGTATTENASAGASAGASKKGKEEESFLLGGDFGITMPDGAKQLAFCLPAKLLISEKASKKEAKYANFCTTESKVSRHDDSCELCAMSLGVGV